ncbi:TonB-dependent receptor [Niveispirillum sp. KHB5.9]|uniref:TonB-dependent receptor n=1 Tax=Niveispirillum sp. KHB5.9 TaxID=3400269 RepID=UPI003A873C7F
MRNRHFHAWLLAGIAMTTASAVAAADAPDDAAPVLEEIIVTAQRRAQNLQNVPLAVTTVSGDALADRNIATTQDLMQIVPSLQVGTQTAGDGGGSATFFLRGMGQQRAGNGSEPAVGVYVDDFYYPSLQGDVFNIVNLASVEVLRGPQGTLFGRNTIGGAIRYNSLQPVLGEVSGHVTGTYGSHDRTDLVGAVNVPLGEAAAMRVSAGHLERDGYVRVQAGGPDAGATQTDLVKLQVKVQPSDELTVDLSGMWNRSDLDGFAYNLPGPLTPKPGPSLPFVYNTVIAPARNLPLYTDALKSTCFYCQPGSTDPEFSTTEYKNVFGTISWEVAPWLSIKSLTGWQHLDSSAQIDLDGTPLPLIGTGIREQSFTAWSQELQFNGSAFDDRLNFVSGLYYYHQDSPAIVQASPAIVLAAPGSLVPAEDRTTKTYAGYIDLDYRLTDALTLLGGFRYSEDHKSDRVLLPAGDLEFDKTFASRTWRAGARYQWTPIVMSYLTVSTGYRGGGFNPYQDATKGVVPFEPEKATNYEAGLRLQFLDRRLTLNPTVFYEDWDRIQVQTVFFPPGSAVGVVVLQNAGTAESKGFELEADYAVLPGLHLTGNMAILDLHYTDIGNATGITVDSPLQRAPKLTWSIGAAYTHDLGSAGDLTTSVNFSHQGRQNSTPTDADTLILPAYRLLNGRVEWTDASGLYSIALFATNLTDEKHYVGGVNYYANAGAAHYDLGRPREFGVTMRVNF